MTFRIFGSYVICGKDTQESNEVLWERVSEVSEHSWEIYSIFLIPGLKMDMQDEEYFEIVPSEIDVIKKTIEIMQKDAQEYKLLFGA